MLKTTINREKKGRGRIERAQDLNEDENMILISHSIKARSYVELGNLVGKGGVQGKRNRGVERGASFAEIILNPIYNQKKGHPIISEEPAGKSLVRSSLKPIGDGVRGGKTRADGRILQVFLMGNSNLFLEGLVSMR